MVDVLDLQPQIEEQPQSKDVSAAEKRPFCNWRVTPQKLFLAASLMFGALAGRAAWMNFDYLMAKGQAEQEVLKHAGFCPPASSVLSVGVEDAQSRLCQQVRGGAETIRLTNDDYWSLVSSQTVSRLHNDMRSYNDELFPITATWGFFVFSVSKMRKLHQKED